jgi:hypothetical protein
VSGLVKIDLVAFRQDYECEFGVEKKLWVKCSGLVVVVRSCEWTVELLELCVLGVSWKIPECGLRGLYTEYLGMSHCRG